MRKILLYALLICSVAFYASGMNPAILGGAGEGGSATDYTADANCMGAWFMNGGLSANGDSETDRSGEDGTLTEALGDSPNDATVPTNYSGTSRDFEYGDTEWLYEADGGSTDISGADQNISYGAWLRIEAVVNGQYLTALGKWDETIGKQYVLYVVGTDTNEFKFKCNLSNDGSAVNYVESTTTNYVTGTYYHVMCVYDEADTGSELRVYVDGASSNTTNYTAGIFNSNCDFGIGALEDNGSMANGECFDGLIDEVVVFNDALTSAEVSNIYSYGIDGSRGGND